MNTVEIKAELESLVGELKNYVDSSTGSLEVKSEDSFRNINERFDYLESLVEARKTIEPVTLDENEHVKTFKDAFSLFVKGQGYRNEVSQKVDVKSGYHNFEVKSDNLVRFDFAASGALLLPAAISAEIIKNVVEATPVLSLARVTRTNRSDYKRRVRTSTPGGRWLAEEASNTKTKPTYGEISIPPQKWAAQYGWTIENEQDTAYNLVNELVQAYREDFAADFGTAFTTGNGIGKPRGLVGNITNYDSAGLALTTDMLIRLQAQLKEPYHANATWLFDRYTRAYIRSLVLSATNGLQYTWEQDFTRRTGTVLLGAPVALSRPGDLAGRVSGNFTAAQVPIIYGDFSQGYEVTMHTDMYMIDDFYTEASSFVRNMHIMSRVGGNVIKEEALVQLTMTAG
jgi:HK97 family phage major capsid protein